MNIAIKHTTFIKSAIALVVLILVISGSWLLFQKAIQAANFNNFKPGNIMSDAVMSNKTSMSVAQIQAFLQSKNACNDTNTAKAAQYPSLQYNIKDGKFLCLWNTTFNGQSAAQIIYDVAQQYTINPQVLIVLLEKEQGLITDTWPNHIQYRSATGFGCPDTAACDSKYYGLKNQLAQAANLFRTVLNDGWSNYPVGNTYVQYNPNAACGGSVINIQNKATSALYRYTPYQPNASAIAAGYGTGDSCGAYGNRNFWRFFSDWFGSTSGTVYNGLDFSRVFNAPYYLNKYPDLKAALGDNSAAAFDHFITYGIKEGRQAIDNFDIVTYRAQNVDLRFAYGANLVGYLEHYVTFGYKEKHRVTTGNRTLVPVTSYKGKDYASVYSFSEYINKYPDIKNLFSNDDAGALTHFATHGIKEGRTGISSFNVNSYRNRYYDLRRALGNDLRQYYVHYIEYGKKEGRTATGDVYGGVASRNGINYSLVYNFDTYKRTHPDISKAYGLNDAGILDHFVVFGMSEGRTASTTFNVRTYRANYVDLRQAFGNDLKQYYLHYINYGHKEGRKAI